jgi:hypothetical protein
MSDEQIKYMVDRFLGWRLPENFNPDGGISFTRIGNEHRPAWAYKNQPTEKALQFHQQRALDLERALASSPAKDRRT